MNKKSVYEFFIGLLALMLALMFVVDIFIPIPIEAKLSFYYIDNIVRVIFIGDYVIRLALSKNRKMFISKNVIDLISLVPFIMYLKIVVLLGVASTMNTTIIVNSLKGFMFIIFFIKFKMKTREEMRNNRVYYLMIISTVIIVIGAVFISLIEGISLGDALWWSFVTFTTVGYGDVLLKTQMGKFVAVILMVFGVGFISITTTALAIYILNGGKRGMKKNYKEKVIDGIKVMLDNYDDLTEEDIESIIKIIRSLKE